MPGDDLRGLRAPDMMRGVLPELWHQVAFAGQEVLVFPIVHNGKVSGTG